MASKAGAPGLLRAPAAGRDARVDVLKAAEVLLVVLEHTHRPFFVSNRPVWEVVLSNLSSTCSSSFIWLAGYAVAAAAAKRAAAGKAAPSYGATMRTQAKRLLPPYLIAVLVGQLLDRDAYNYALLRLDKDLGWMFVAPERKNGPRLLAPPGTVLWAKTVLYQTVMFKTRGLHYYVSAALWCAAVTPLVARLCASRGRGVAFVTACFVLRIYCNDETLIKWLKDVGWQYLVQVEFLPIWLPFYAGGYISGLHGIRVKPHVFAALLIPYVIALPLTDFQDGLLNVLRKSALGLGLVAVPPLVFTTVSEGLRTPAIVRFLSDSTYTIYLFHIYFVEAYARLVDDPAGRTMRIEPSVATVTCRYLVGLVGAVVLVVASVLVLGKQLTFTLLGSRATTIGR